VLTTQTLPILLVTFWPEFPGVSISVEQLFSSSKHTLSDTHSSLTEVSALKTVVVKEWLKKGFGADVNYLDEVRTIVS
jgi:hypothetical protein